MRDGIEAGDEVDPPLTRRERRDREQREREQQRKRVARPNREARSGRGAAIVAMLSALGIAVATTVPAMALLTEDDVRATSASTHFSGARAREGDVQALDSVTAGERQSVVRDSGAATSGEQLAALRSMRIADTFRSDPAAAVQWPFPVGVPISDGFGPRVAPTDGASTDHLGVDFTPGDGVPVQIIADGVVRQVVTRDDGGCGVNVTIDHTIGGAAVSSRYCHLQAGSVRIAKGQQVSVADIVGRVGNTGVSTGAHLHFEIRLNGVEAVDPIAWLRAHAG